MQRKDVDAHEEAAMKQHNRLLLAGYCILQQEMNARKEESGRRGKETIEIKVKHAELTGAEPFVPRYPSLPTRIYSEPRVVDGRTFRLDVDTNFAPDHYGLFLNFDGGPLPCKIKWAMQLVHHDGQATSAKTWSSEHTYEIYEARGRLDFVPKARLADAATSPYVKNGYVTFKCTFEVVE